MRRPQWIPWAFVVPFVAVACSSDPVTPVPGDSGVDVVTDEPIPEDVPVPPMDTGPRDTGGGEDVKAMPDVPPPPKDVPGTDTGPEDVPPPPEDVPPPPEDVPPPPEDVPSTPDVPIVPDVPPTMDVPAVPDVPPPLDVPVTPDVQIDRPVTPDVPVDRPIVNDVPVDRPTDVPLVCPPLQRALRLPMDTAMGTTMGASLVPGTSCTATSGPEHVYPLAVTARTGVLLSTTAMYDTVLAVRRTCNSATGEVACVDDVPGTNNATLRTVLEPGNYFVLVDQYGSSGGTGGAYTLNLRAYTPADNGVCSAARALTPGMTVMGNTTAGGAASGACITDQWGPQLFYTVQIPPGQRAVVTATPTGMPAWRATVRGLQSCTAAACLASATSATDNGAAVTRINNRGTTPLTAVVSVSSASATTGGTFNLGATLERIPTPTNTTCMNATAVMNGTSLTDQDASGGTENATGACLPTATGTVLYYRATVGAGETLRVTATPTSPSVNPVIRALNACGATSCLGSSDSAGAGQPETLTYSNRAMGPQTVYLAVGGATNASNGAFNLAVSLARDYTLTTITRACDDMMGATAVPGVNGDDTSSAIIDLPFPFVFFGERQLEYSVSSNGLVQLWPSLAGMPSASLDNTAIPNAAAPNRFIAAFWDDLFPEMGSQALTRTLGTAPNRRFVVQWTNFSNYNDRMARMTFQAKLFETTNVIELHYCAITPGAMPPLATGSSATIGIENADGTRGRQHSHNTAMSVSAMTGLRFTP